MAAHGTTWTIRPEEIPDPGVMAHGEGGMLLKAALADPGDDVARMAYADWLEEHGHDDRARHLRENMGPGGHYMATECFTVKAGTPCFVRRQHAPAWQPHVTVVTLHYDEPLWTANGWTSFANGEWEVRVPVRDVMGVDDEAVMTKVG